MMESSNNVSLDLHHYYQEELHGRSSSSSSSFQFVGRDYDWINQDHLLLNNGGDFLDPNSNVGSVLASQEMMTPAGVMQDLGFQWDPLLLNGEGYYMIDNNNYNSTTTPSSSPSSSSYSHQLAHFSEQMKEELPLGLINGNHLVQDYFNQISSGLHQQPAFGPGPGGSFGMVLPSANISSSMSNGSSCLGMDQFQAVSQPSLGNNISNMAAFYREDFDYATFGQLQAQEGVSKLPSHSLSGVTEAKRTNSGHGDSRSYQSIAKKPRFESRSSFAPFKVRKEKLGDRIASLQQLVAPFGKTDTASVLMEAIGYIKFLQDQVETLSVPYMRSSNTKLKVSQGASNEEKDEAKPDLRSRGLCLVPLSCTSYVDTNENGGVWSPPNYGGGI